MSDTPRWGFMELQPDGTLVFVPVPKTPLRLGSHVPPVTFRLFSGERTIIEEPEGT